MAKAESKKTEETKVLAKKFNFVKNDLTYLNHGLFKYNTKDLKECKEEGFFTCPEARNLAVRKGDVVMVVTEESVEHIVVR